MTHIFALVFSIILYQLTISTNFAYADIKVWENWEIVSTTDDDDDGCLDRHYMGTFTAGVGQGTGGLPSSAVQVASHGLLGIAWNAAAATTAEDIDLICKGFCRKRIACIMKNVYIQRNPEAPQCEVKALSYEGGNIVGFGASCTVSVFLHIDCRCQLDPKAVE